MQIHCHREHWVKKKKKRTNISFCSLFQKKQEDVLIPHKDVEVDSYSLVTQDEDKLHVEGLISFK